MYRHTPYKGKDTGSTRGGMGFATIRRDRFAALQASFDGGELLTRPLVIKGRTIHLNAKANFGEIGVTVLDAEGQVIAESKPVQQDGLDLTLEWKKGSLPDDGAPVRLKMTLKNPSELDGLLSAADYEKFVAEEAGH